MNDADVTILAGSTNIRAVQYTGLMRLVKFAPGVKATAILNPFFLPFRMAFQRSSLR